MKYILAFMLMVGTAWGAKTTTQLKQDLVGINPHGRPTGKHNLTGGREATWHFDRLDQIKGLHVDNVVGDVYYVSVILQDTKFAGTGKYLARLKITYKGPAIESVGLLYIQRLDVK